VTSEIPLHKQIIDLPGQSDEYDEGKAEELAQWCFALLDHAADGRRENTRERSWDSDWEFISGKQWEGSMPSFRRPITVNVWRRDLHILLATLLGERPLLKVIPQGSNPAVQEVWQHALWALMRRERVLEKYAGALSWGLVGDGGWMKVGYGARDMHTPGVQPDVMVSSPHPHCIYPDPDCTDMSLMDCGYIIYRDVLDLKTIARRYPEHGWRASPDGSVSVHGREGADAPSYIKGSKAIAPAGGWTTGQGMMRARCEVAEVWIDDPATELMESKEAVGVDLASGMAIMRTRREWVPKYPHGRVITCTDDVILRDIPNPYGSAFGWELRWPFVYVPGAEHPNVLFRPGLIADQKELQAGINKACSLVLENSIKVTNAIIVADHNAMEDEDWMDLSLIPGAKIRKRQGTEVNIRFPEPLPPQAFQLPDFLIRKMEEISGLHDPPITPGQAVAAKTVSYMQQKGSYLMGSLSKLTDAALERLGSRIVGLQRDRYLPNRKIPYFEGEALKVGAESLWPELPQALTVRVEAGSGFQEMQQQMQVMAQAEAASRKKK
jgi:hypothetical protein